MTAETRPTRPWPFTTASFTRTPWSLPASIVTVEYQAVVERAITRAWAKRAPLGNTAESRILQHALELGVLLLDDELLGELRRAAAAPGCAGCGSATAR